MYLNKNHFKTIFLYILNAKICLSKKYFLCDLFNTFFTQKMRLHKN